MNDVDSVSRKTQACPTYVNLLSPCSLLATPSSPPSYAPLLTPSSASSSSSPKQSSSGAKPFSKAGNCSYSSNHRMYNYSSISSSGGGSNNYTHFQHHNNHNNNNHHNNNSNNNDEDEVPLPPVPMLRPSGQGQRHRWSAENHCDDPSTFAANKTNSPVATFQLHTGDRDGSSVYSLTKNQGAKNFATSNTGVNDIAKGVR